MRGFFGYDDEEIKQQQQRAATMSKFYRGEVNLSPVNAPPKPPTLPKAPPAAPASGAPSLSAFNASYADVTGSTPQVPLMPTRAALAAPPMFPPAPPPAASPARTPVPTTTQPAAQPPTATPPAARPAPVDPYAGTIYEGQGLPPGPDPTAPGQILLDRKLPSFFKAIGFNATLPVDAAAAAAPPPAVPVPAATPPAPTTPLTWEKVRQPTASAPAGASAQPPATGKITSAQQAYNTPNSIFFGGKGKQFTQEELATMAGPASGAPGRTPMEIYMNELALLKAFPDRVRGAMIADPRRGDWRPGRAPARSQNAAAEEAAYFGHLAKGGDLEKEKARADLKERQDIAVLRQKVMAAKTPQEQRQHIDALMALLGKKGGQPPLVVPAGEVVTPDGMGGYVTSKAPSAVYDTDTGRFITQPGAAAPPKTIDRKQLEAVMKEGGMDEATARNYLQQHGYRVN